MAVSERFSGETMPTILQRMLDEISEDVDKRQGSVVYDMQAPAAVELAQAYIALDQVLTFGFASEDMPREYLVLRAAELGVIPRAATAATGQVTFFGQNGTPIPAGTRISTDGANPQYFVTTSSGTISGGQAILPVIAEQAGADGNVSAGDIALVLGDLSGILDVTNTNDFEGGANEESDESLLDRYFRRAQRGATSGNVSHYEQWALEVAGVGNVKVIPIWSGPGTVKVVILGEDNRAPDGTIISNVSDYIESQRPIGATVTVAPSPEIGINVSADITLAAGATVADAVTSFEARLDEYLSSLAYTDPIVRYTQITGILLNVPEVVDFSNLTVNGDITNVNIDIVAGDVAVRGAVTFNDAG